MCYKIARFSTLFVVLFFFFANSNSKNIQYLQMWNTKYTSGLAFLDIGSILEEIAEYLMRHLKKTDWFFRLIVTKAEFKLLFSKCLNLCS